VDGFRVSILLYKTHRHQRCHVCGDRGAIHWVSVTRKTDKMDGDGDFCDTCRPHRGTLPPLVYTKQYENGPFVTVEALNPHPDWECLCGQRARFYDRIHCDGCDDPEFQEFCRHSVIPFGQPERVEEGFRTSTTSSWSRTSATICRLNLGTAP
jgi:hypothetical protein